MFRSLTLKFTPWTTLRPLAVSLGLGAEGVPRCPARTAGGPLGAGLGEQLSTELRKARPDVVVIDVVLLGAIAAAEAAGIIGCPYAQCPLPVSARYSAVWPLVAPGTRAARARESASVSRCG